MSLLNKGIKFAAKDLQKQVGKCHTGNAYLALNPSNTLKFTRTP